MVDAIAWLLIVVPALPLATALILGQHIRSESPSLAERALIAVRDCLVASMAALLALNRILGWGWPGQVIVLVLGMALILVSVPSAYWLWQYRRGAFR